MRGPLLFAFLAFALSGLVAQPIDTIEYFDFDGGLEPFTANPGTPDAEARWRWTASGKGDTIFLSDDEFLEASFWGDETFPGIGSPSAINGAAVFNSDAYDSDGSGEPGTGPYPAPHTAELVSPIIDCSDRETVVLSFYQYARTLFDNYTVLEVSNDGGISWENVPINERLFSNEINANTAPDTWTYIDISEIAGGESEVQVRFTWLNGDYYFWLLDDVLISGPPEYNVGLDTLFYPVSNFGTPETQILTDTFGFSGLVSNFGSEDVPNLVIRASVYDTRIENGQLVLGDSLFADSTVLDILPSGYRDSLVSIEGTFAPELPEGRYVIFYETYSQNEDIVDYYPFDNIWSSTFQATADLFAKDNGFLFDDAETPVGLGSSEDFEVGNLYTMSSLSGTGFAATRVTFAAGLSAASGGELPGKEVTIKMYRMKDDVDPGFGNFNLESVGDPDDPEDDLEIVGLGNYIFDGNESPFDSIEVGIETFLGEPVPLDPAARYLLVCSYASPDNDLLHLYADDYDYPNPEQGFISSLFFEDGRWFLIDRRNTISPILWMKIELIDAIDETPLPETAMTLFPNPATDLLRLQIGLEEPSEGVVIITDVSGRILRWQEYDRLQNEILEFDVSAYPAGQYFLRLGTELGTRTKKFLVVR